MTSDSLSVLGVKLSDGGLPWPILAVLLVCYFAFLVYALSQAKQFKSYSQDFPSQTAPVVVALFLTLVTAPVILSLFALGKPLPDGVVAWLTFLGTLAGVAGVGGLAVKRFSSPEYKEGQAKVEAAKASATPPVAQMNVAGDASVQSAPAPAAPTPFPAKTPTPFGGMSND